MATSPNAEHTGTDLRARLSEIRSIEQRDGAGAAETALIGLLRDEPKSHQAFLALARVLLKQKKLTDAARAAQKAKQLAPLEVEPVIAEGFVHLRSKDNAKAAQAFADAIRLDPDSARAHLGAAAVKMADESYEDALKLCDRVIDLDPSLERAHELVARIKLRQGHADQAIDELKSLIQKNPSNNRVLKAYVRLMRAEGRTDEVITVLEADAAENPDDRQGINRLARVAIRTGRPDVAVAQYKRLVGSGTARLSDKVLYATSLIASGDIDEAEAVISELGDRPILVPVVTKLRGDIALKAGDPDTAIVRYRKACTAAKVPLLPVDDEASAETPEEKAKLWKAHTRKNVLEAMRQWRSERR